MQRGDLLGFTPPQGFIGQPYRSPNLAQIEENRAPLPHGPTGQNTVSVSTSLITFDIETFFRIGMFGQ
jgi:hypothetical protein